MKIVDLLQLTLKSMRQIVINKQLISISYIKWDSDQCCEKMKQWSRIRKTGSWVGGNYKLKGEIRAKFERERGSELNGYFIG